MVLGQISQINRYDIALSLPNNLTGYIPLTSISDKITQDVEALAMEDDASSGEEEMQASFNIELKNFFSVGQYLRAYVSSTEDSAGVRGKAKKHIVLSINPRQANVGLKRSDVVVYSMVQAMITSVEDHGLVMSLGLEDSTVRGFMGTKDLGSNRKLSAFKEGSVVLCLVVGFSSNGNIVKLCADLERIGNVKKRNFLTDAPTVDTFLPGTAVELLVSEVKATGISGKVMGLLDVTADIIHSGAAASGKPLEKKYPIGSKVKGRIICTFPTADEKKLGISLLDHLVALTSHLPSSQSESVLPVGSIVDQARVAKVEPGFGLFVDLGIKGARGFVHISYLSGKKIENLSESTGPFKAGSVHRGRVIGYNSMDGLFLVSFEQKIIDLPFLRLEDVQVGQTVEGIVSKLIVNGSGVSGVLVSITETISGLVPEIHLADIHLQHPEKKFKEGLLVKTRVLSVDLERRMMRLTLKKSLINSDASIWKSYDDLEVGMQAPGTLINILPAGAVVQFYGAIRAFLPVSQMSESYIQDPKQHFRMGQVVNVNIMTVDPNEKRMVVSCRDPSAFGAAQQQALIDLRIGSIVSGTVSEKTGDEIIVDISGSGLRATLPFEHLVDGSAAKAVSAAKKIRVGQTLQDLTIISKNEKKRLVKLTSKPSLVKASKHSNLPKSLEDIRIGAEVFGFVKNIISAGVFVQFAGDLTGFLPMNQLANDLRTLPEFGLRRQQSISAKVLSVNTNQERFALTQKPTTEQQIDHEGVASAATIVDRSLLNAADETSCSIDDFTLGKLTRARILSVKETQMNVQLADKVQGRVDISQVFDSWDDIKDRKYPLKSFNAKQVLPVRILGVHDSRNHRFLPITHSNKAPVFELTAKPKDQTDAKLDILTLDDVKPDSAWLAFVNNVSEDCLWVNISPNVRGRVRAMDVSDDVSLLADLGGNFPIGSALRVRVVHVDATNNRLDLSARTGTSSTPMSLSDLSKGMVLPARVTKVTERYMMVQMSEQLSAPVQLVDLTDDYDLANPTIYQKNQIIRVCVTDLDVPNKKIVLSTRPSKVLSSSLEVKDPEITSILQIKVNDILRGFIKNVADNGIFISLASNITGFVRVSDISDSFIKDWKSGFEIDQLVAGKVTAIDPTLHHIQMSLKQSVLDKDYKAPLTYADIEVGQIVTGKIRKVEDFGVFIVVDHSSNVSGLCHRSEIAEDRIADVKKLYEEGDAVKAKVLKLDLEKRRISFGLKASYFLADEMYHTSNGDEHDNGNDDDDDDDDDDEADGTQLPKLTDDEMAEIEFEERGSNFDSVRDMEVDQDDVSIENRDLEPEIMNDELSNEPTKVTGLTTSGFDWSGGFIDQEKQDALSETDGEAQPTRKKRNKAEIKVDRTGELDANGPQSVADFERLLMGQPNSSYLWLSYMAFQLQLSELLKAREVTERALRTIKQTRETDSEVLNVWVAYLNLENTYGSDETVEEIFSRACEHNDAEEIHSRLTSIYIQSGKNEVRRRYIAPKTTC